MKLRTVLGELKATAYVEGPDVNYDGDVVVFPGRDLSRSFPEMLILDVDGTFPDPSQTYVGITLRYVGPALPESLPKSSGRVCYFASPLSTDELRQVFRTLPELHMHLDLQRKRLYQAFQSSYDIQRYADFLCEILGNPLMIVNSDRRLLASAGDFPEDRADVLEEINQGYVSEEVNAELEAEGILDDVRHAGHSIISENERFGQRWVTSVITFHHMEMGRFDLLEHDRPVTDTDLELVDFAGSLAGVMIDKLGIAGERAGSGSSVLDDILDNTFANEKTMRAQLTLSSMPLDETYVLVELVGDREIPRAHLQRIAARVTGAFRNSLWTIRDGTWWCWWPSVPRTCGLGCYERAERILGQRTEFLRTLAQNGLRAYVSEPFEQLSFARDRYQQIRDLMAAASWRTGPIVYFWQHRYRRAREPWRKTFGQADMMLDKRVVAMRLYDRDHGTAYLETACSTVEFPGSPAEAAKALNVHRNTYFYRVNKIAELFYLDLRRGEDRLAVAFSTRFLEGMGNPAFDADQMPGELALRIRRGDWRSVATALGHAPLVTCPRRHLWHVPLIRFQTIAHAFHHRLTLLGQ